MSTAGIYNYHPKVANPNKILPQMKSLQLQPPFFLGASQVPLTLGIETEMSTDHPHHYTHDKMKGMGLSKNAQYTTHEIHTKIMMPKHHKRV
jgi:hypothetical protein